MTESTLATTLLDLRGLLNPEPVAGLAAAAERLDPGDRLEVLSDDPCAISDFIRWSAGSEVDLVSIDYETEGVNRFMFVRRAPVPEEVGA